VGKLPGPGRIQMDVVDCGDEHADFEGCLVGEQLGFLVPSALAHKGAEIRKLDLVWADTRKFRGNCRGQVFTRVLWKEMSSGRAYNYAKVFRRWRTLPELGELCCDGICNDGLQDHLARVLEWGLPHV